MTTKTYTIPLTFKITLGDEDTDENELPEYLDREFKDYVAERFKNLDDFYDGFTDGFIEQTGFESEYDIEPEEHSMDAVYFLLRQIEDIITDGEDFDFEKARLLLSPLGIDIDKDYFQP